ncbi:hypothetical protein L208DRAFT_477733 [Tricholoma matsutake]|nr:hypothetical protein L208DRAFT_477733 [Tricholoma matsutake 945]
MKKTAPCKMRGWPGESCLSSCPCRPGCWAFIVAVLVIAILGVISVLLLVMPFLGASFPYCSWSCPSWSSLPSWCWCPVVVAWSSPSSHPFVVLALLLLSWLCCIPWCWCPVVIVWSSPSSHLFVILASLSLSWLCYIPWCWCPVVIAWSSPSSHPSFHPASSCSQQQCWVLGHACRPLSSLSHHFCGRLLSSYPCLATLLLSSFWALPPCCSHHLQLLISVSMVLIVTPHFHPTSSCSQRWRVWWQWWVASYNEKL